MAARKSEPLEGQGELFKAPTGRSRRKTKRLPEPGRLYDRAYKGKSTTCDLCIVDVHEGNVTGPRDYAKHVLERDGISRLVCIRHKELVVAGRRGL